MIPDRLSVLAILGAAFLAYSNTLENGFVWEDHIYVEQNPFLQKPANVREILSPGFFRQVFPVRNGARPVWILSLLIDKALWGAEPWGYHLTNLLLHGANGVLLYALARALGAHGWLALLASLVFVLHPIQTEAVNCISFRSDLLALMFMLSSLLAYRAARHVPRQGGAAPRRPAGLFLALSLCLYALGLLSKEMAASLPLLILLMDWLFGDLARVGKPGLGGRPGLRRPRVVRRLWVYGCFAAVTLAYLHFRHFRSGYAAIAPEAPAAWVPWAPPARPEPLAPSDHFLPSIPPWQEVYRDPALNTWTMLGVFYRHWRSWFKPFQLEADNRVEVISSVWHPWVWMAALLLCGSGFAVFRMRRACPLLSFGLAWIWTTLLPVSNFFPLFNLMAARYLYVVSAGFSLALAFLAAWAAGQSLLARRAALAAAVSILLGSGTLTYLRNLDWRSDERLFRLGESTRSTEGHRWPYNRGVLYYLKGHRGYAREQFLDALRIHPAFVEAIANVCATYADEGRGEEALPWCLKATQLGPRSVQAWDGLGELFLRQGRMDEAAKALERARGLDPRYVPARLHLARAWLEQGKVDEATLELKETVRLHPAWAQARLELGMAYLRRSRFKAAVREFKKVLALKSRDADATLHLGVAYHGLGENALAVGWLKRAKGLAPRAPLVYYNLGVGYAASKQWRQAARELGRAVELDPQFDAAWVELAKVRQRLGGQR